MPVTDGVMAAPEVVRGERGEKSRTGCVRSRQTANSPTNGKSCCIIVVLAGRTKGWALFLAENLQGRIHRIVKSTGTNWSYTSQQTSPCRMPASPVQLKAAPSCAV